MEMKVDLDTLTPVRRKINVELPAEAVDEEFTRVCGTLSHRARIKGFRPGKVPRGVVQGIYRDEIRSQVLSHLVEHSLREVFKDNSLQVVSRPEVETGDLIEGKPFSFSAVVEVKPEVELKEYLGLEVEKIKLSVQDDQVDEALRRLQDAHAHLEPIEDRDVVERGDSVLLDFDGTIGGSPFPGGKGEGYLLEVGGGEGLPQFEEALVGLKKDAEHTIHVTYPKEHPNQDLAGKDAAFRVIVRELKKKILPPLDDEFAKDYGECASLEELRGKVKGRLEEGLREAQTRGLKDQLLTRLIEGHPFEVPETMVNDQVRYLMGRHQYRTGSQDSVRAGAATDQLRSELEPQARRQVKAMFLVDKIAALENIEVPDEEVRVRIENLARAAKDKGAALRELYRREEVREEIRSQIVFEKTMDLLLERAKVREVESPAREG